MQKRATPSDAHRPVRIGRPVKRFGVSATKREVVKGIGLGARLKAAAHNADAGPDGTNVTDMEPDAFIALLRR